MGKKNRKSKVERLPREERTIVGPKVSTMQVSPSQQQHQVSSSSSSTGTILSDIPVTIQRPSAEAEELSFLPTTSSVPVPASVRTFLSPSISSDAPCLDSDSLRRILLRAGPASILTATRVCHSWANVAYELLRDTHRLDLSQIAFPHGQVSSSLAPEPSSLLRIAHSFPNLRDVSLRAPRRCAIDTAHLSSGVLTGLKAPRLSRFELHSMAVSAEGVARLLSECTKLHSLTLSACPGVDDALLDTVARVLARSRPVKSRLQCIDVSMSPNVFAAGLRKLMEKDSANEIVACSCPGLEALQWEAHGDAVLTSITVNSCNSLNTLQITSANLQFVNASHCTRLHTVSLLGSSAAAVAARASAVKKLNLSGCRQLRNLNFRPEDFVFGANAGANSDHEYNPQMSIAPHLEELNLFGVRSLSPQVFVSAMGLSSRLCAMPALKRLNLNGTQVETVRLIGYEYLETVDCSGCSSLNTVQIEGSWNMKSVLLSSRKAPLTLVRLILPPSAQLTGLRNEWSWQKNESQRIVQYGNWNT